ncbi:tetratricopeptide repeat protein [Micromonospora sp. CPCC 205371]|nr:tetratricopeptide repeat protein [Micromonospora sp. CPCC 205371]
MDLRAEYERAKFYVALGNPAEAARILEPVAAAEPRNAEVRLELAMAYFASAQLRNAERELRVLIERDPSDAYAHHLLGRTLERQNRHADALSHLRIAAAMSTKPEYAEAARRVADRVGKRKPGM